MKTTWFNVLFRWGRIPLVVKLLYTAFVCVLVPIYWHLYGPTNFLYFCDVALLLTVPACGWKARCWRRCRRSAFAWHSCCGRSTSCADCSVGIR